MAKISDLLVANLGSMGVVPMLLAEKYKKQQAEDAAEQAAKMASVGNVGAVAKPMKKGGSVKGWGKARGARKAKMY